MEIIRGAIHKSAVHIHQRLSQSNETLSNRIPSPSSFDELSASLLAKSRTILAEIQDLEGKKKEWISTHVPTFAKTLGGSNKVLSHPNGAFENFKSEETSGRESTVDPVDNTFDGTSEPIRMMDVVENDPCETANANSSSIESTPRGTASELPVVGPGSPNEDGLKPSQPSGMVTNADVVSLSNLLGLIVSPIN